MINFAHLGLSVSDLAKSKKFYIQALAALGLKLVKEGERYARFGLDNGRTMFYIYIEKRATSSGPVHIAFEAETRSQVDEFYKAGLAAGGRDNGAPGIRENYSPNYYAAFLFDPDGNNVEAVCR